MKCKGIRVSRSDEKFTRTGDLVTVLGIPNPDDKSWELLAVFGGLHMSYSWTRRGKPKRLPFKLPPIKVEASIFLNIFILFWYAEQRLEGKINGYSTVSSIKPHSFIKTWQLYSSPSNIALYFMSGLH